MSNRFFSFQALIEATSREEHCSGSIFLQPCPPAPDNCQHRSWVFNNMTNFSSVPKASLQLHSSRQKLFVWALCMGSILSLEIIYYRFWFSLSFSEACTLYTAAGWYWVLTHTRSHPCPSTKMFLSRAPVTSRFPGLMDISLVVSYSAF